MGEGGSDSVEGARTWAAFRVEDLLGRRHRRFAKAGPEIDGELFGLTEIVNEYATFCCETGVEDSRPSGTRWAQQSCRESEFRSC